MVMTIPYLDKDIKLFPFIKMGGGRMILTVLHSHSRCNTVRAFQASAKGDYFHETGEVKADYHVDFYEVTKFKIDPMEHGAHGRYSIDGEAVNFAPLTVTIEQGALHMLSF